MPYRKVEFANNEIYHIILRGIDGNTIFKDLNDHYRGIFSIYEFNNSKPTDIRERRRARDAFKIMIKVNKSGGGPTSADSKVAEARRPQITLMKGKN